MHKKTLVFKDIDEISEFVIKKWKGISERAIREGNRVCIAISGGKTPIKLYQKLADTKNIAWNKTHLFMVDERFVSLNNPVSNSRMVRENLLNRIDIPQNNIHYMHIQKTAKVTAKKYEQEIKRFFNLRRDQLPRLDLIILGIGEDGHIASLFPENKALSERRHLVCAVHQNRLKNGRISITFPVINHARNIIFLVTGKNKAAILKGILEKSKNSLPVSLVKPRQGRVFFLIDEKAAALLKNNGKN